jgi:hypothetical protein
MTALITPRALPDEVRMETGMVLARLEKATDRRPEVRKVIVLVRTTTERRPVSLFAPDPWSETKDVTQWHYVRLRGSTDAPDVSPLLGPGSLGAGRERVLRRMYRFVGYLGDIRGGIDWDAL